MERLIFILLDESRSRLLKNMEKPSVFLWRFEYKKKKKKKEI